MDTAVTCHDVFGDGLLLNCRISFERNSWLPFDSVTCDGMTGNQLSIVGEMPVLVSRSVATDRIRDFLSCAGIPFPSNVITYVDRFEQARILNESAEKGVPVVVQHALHETELPSRAWWIEPAVLSQINNKANLASLVPEPFLPRRRFMSPGELVSERPALPFVVKATTDDSTGGGFDVAICRIPSDLVMAVEKLSTSEQVVVEEYLEMKRNLCLNYAVFHTGDVKYLGAAEQIVGVDGTQAGNWIGITQAPKEMIDLGVTIMARARDMGFYGVAGFDACVSKDDRIAVFDLNFRMQACTAPVLVFEALFGESTAKVGRLRRWSSAAGFEQMSGGLQQWIERGEVIPMAAFDEEASSDPAAKAACTIITCGDSRDDVERIDRELVDSGLFA